MLKRLLLKELKLRKAKTVNFLALDFEELERVND
jgi:hypothetical protein